MIADFDNDGMMEIIVGSGAAGDDEFKLYVFHYDGSIMDGWPITVCGDMYGSPAVGDIDADGDLEIVLGAYGIKSFVYVWHHDGTLLDGWPKPVHHVTASPTIQDVDNDGDLEVIIGTDFFNDSGDYAKVSIWHHDGTDVEGWPRLISDYDYSYIDYSSPAVGDIDADGDLEIVIGVEAHMGGDGRGYVYAWHSNGSIVSGWPVYTGLYGYVFSSPALGDIDSDGDLEIITGTDNGLVYAWHHNGINVSGWPKFIPSWIRSQALADIDNDGSLEIISGSVSNRSVYVWNGDGSLLEGWPKTTNGFIYSSPIVGNIDGDKNLEIIASSFDHKVYAWHHDGTLVSSFPLETGDEISSTPCLADLDNDGDIEVIVGSRDKKLHVWDLNYPYDLENMEWPMFQHDTYHTGLYTFGRGFSADANGPYFGLVNETIEFIGSVIGGTPPYQWHWDFSDGTSSTDQNPVHTYNMTGLYIVNLTVEDDEGNIANDNTTVIVSIHIIEEVELNIASISGGVGISAVIENVGRSDAMDVNWSIQFNGGYILIPVDRTAKGVIDIPIGEQKEIYCFVLGFGILNPIEIVVTVEKDDYLKSGSVSAKVVFFYVSVL